MKQKLGRNDPCPCGTGKKYKACCLGLINWSSVLTGTEENYVRHLSLRGKNVYFINKIADALDLDPSRPPRGLSDLKKRFTSDAVRNIYTALLQCWPDESDLKRLLRGSADETVGIYTGTYDPSLLQRGIARHSLYSDRIMLIDPLPYPLLIKEEYNPLVHPEKWLADTMRWVIFWWQLVPWVDSGLVSMIRSPGDFDTFLEFATMRAAQERIDADPDLERILKEEVKRLVEGPLSESYKSQILLSLPDEHWADVISLQRPDLSSDQLADVLNYIRELRESNPFVAGNIADTGGQMLHVTSGLNYDMAKIVAETSGAHLITDMEFRWRELESDRRKGGGQFGPWTGFSKAFHGLRMKCLNNIPLDAALGIRKDGYLEDMRALLRRAWVASASQDDLAEENVPNLTAELQSRVREAEEEWNKIDRILAKSFGVTAAGALAAMGPAIAVGGAEWVAGALAVSGITDLYVTRRQRRSLPRRFPAAFFLRLEHG